MPFSAAKSRRFLPYAAAVLVGAAAIVVSLQFLPPDEGPPVANEKLVIVSGEDPTGVRQELVDRWNEANPRAQAELREVPGNTGQQRLAIRAALADGSAAIAVLDSVHLSEFAAPQDGGAEGLLAELKSDGTLTNGFLPGPLATCYWKQTLYGLPFNTDVGLLFSAGGVQPPKDLTELTASAGTATDRKRIALQLGANEAFVVNVLEQMLAKDDTILNATGTDNVVQLEKWEAAIEPLKKAYDAGVIVDSASEDASTEAFKSGEVRYMRNWPSQFKKIDGQPGVRRLFGPGVLGGQNLVVSRKTRDTPRYAQSLELLRFLTNAESQQQLFRLGGFAPTRKTTYVEPQVKKDVPYAAELLAAVEAARPRPVTAKYEDVSRLILNNLRPAVLVDRRIDDSFERDMMEALHD